MLYKVVQINTETKSEVVLLDKLSRGTAERARDMLEKINNERIPNMKYEYVVREDK